MTPRERVRAALAHQQPGTPLQNVLAFYRTVARRRGREIVTP